MSKRSIVVLTGGPGGGKTTLIDELSRDPRWAGRFAALPEAIFNMHRINISSQEKLFQRVMVHLQMALEDGLARGLAGSDSRLIICHRGSLDPLAYWLQRGWSREAFFTFTNTRLEDHVRRYTAVLHLVTAADGATDHYRRWPDAHRPETPEQAIELDRLLHQVWRDHPCYFRLDNLGVDWTAKSSAARRILFGFLPNPIREL